MKSTEQLLRRELRDRHWTRQGARFAVFVWLGLIALMFVGCAQLADYANRVLP